jgi:hypothetical protein
VGWCSETRGIASYGDIDLLIVLPAATNFLSRSIISRLQEYRTIFASRLLCDLLLQLYISNKTLPAYIPSTEEMEDFLTQGETLIRSFLAAKSTFQQ